MKILLKVSAGLLLSMLILATTAVTRMQRADLHLWQMWIKLAVSGYGDPLDRWEPRQAEPGSRAGQP